MSEQRIHLRPKGAPQPYASWFPGQDKERILIAETTEAWICRPVDNPKCPDLIMPKWAWEIVGPKPTTNIDKPPAKAVINLSNTFWK